MERVYIFQRAHSPAVYIPSRSRIGVLHFALFLNVPECRVKYTSRRSAERKAHLREFFRKIVNP